MSGSIAIAEGTVLTCSHAHCGCRIVVTSACGCDHEDGATYTCACGAPMQPVDEGGH